MKLFVEGEKILGMSRWDTDIYFCIYTDLKYVFLATITFQLTDGMHLYGLQEASFGFKPRELWSGGMASYILMNTF